MVVGNIHALMWISWGPQLCSSADASEWMGARLSWKIIGKMLVASSHAAPCKGM